MMTDGAPSSQFGYRMHRWGDDPVWEELPVGSPGPGEALVRVEACGVGLTVLNCINGDLSDDPALLPRVPGHELVGRVLETGPGADPLLVGRRVVAYFYLACGECPECLAGDDPLCRRLAGFVGVHRDGGYAPYTVLPTLNLIPIPDDVDPVAATVIPDAVATPVHVANRAGIVAGDRVAVLGAGGGVGAHMVQVAATRGADVAGLDVTTEKLEQVERLGARAVDSSDFSALPATLFDGSPPSVVVDLLGLQDGTRWAIDSLGAKGRMVALTTFRGRPVSVESRELVFREISLLGSRYAAKTEVAQAAHLVASGAVQPVIGAVAGPDDVPDLHARLRSGDLLGRGALQWGRPDG